MSWRIGAFAGAALTRAKGLVRPLHAKLFGLTHLTGVAFKTA
jgi:hypothetical protein